MKTHTKMILVFIPALAIVGLFLFVRIVQYEPLLPKTTPLAEQEAQLQIPILPTDPIIGNPKAAKTIVLFEDFGCEQCKFQSELLDQLQQEYPDQVKIIFKGLSVTRFPQDSRLAHQYAVCMHEQKKFEEFKKFAFVNYQNLSETVVKTIAETIGANQNKLNDCLGSSRPDDYLDTNETIARGIGIQSVPSFFIDKKQIQPPLTLDGWKTMLGL